MGGLTAIATLQRNGHFQCESVTITFGEDIWENAWVQNENMVLVYSYFNGVYKHSGTHAGRPVYREMRKSMDTPFETKIGALIKYCVEESAWVLTHTNIRKSRMPEEVSIDGGLVLCIANHIIPLHIILYQCIHFVLKVGLPLVTPFA